MSLIRVTLAATLVVCASWSVVPAAGQVSSPTATLGVFLQLGFAFPFAEYRNGHWRESELPGSPGPWVFRPFQSDVPRTIESGVPVPTTFCGNLVGPLMPVREAHAAAGKPSSSDVHASFGLLHRGSVLVMPLLERGASATQSNAFSRIDEWLRRELMAAAAPAGSTQVVKAWRTPDAPGGASVARVEVDVTPPGDRMRVLRLEAWLVLQASGEVHVVERSLEPDAGDGIKSSTTVRPLGVVTVDGRVFIVTDEHGWEHVDYVIRERSDHTLIERLRVQGPCAG